MKKVDKFLESIRKGMNISILFGESRQIGSKTIIPVAQVIYGMGSGEGKAKAVPKQVLVKSEEIDEPGTDEPGCDEKDEKSSKNKDDMTGKGDMTGEGFGGGFNAKPLGVFQITEDRTIFLPVFSSKQIIFIGLTFLWLFRKKRKRR